jgi:hypothetical protein
MITAPLRGSEAVIPCISASVPGFTAAGPMDYSFSADLIAARTM